VPRFLFERRQLGERLAEGLAGERRPSRLEPPGRTIDLRDQSGIERHLDGLHIPILVERIN
jgi:hypothetical protein